MDTSREDVGITIRSALLAKGTKQKFSLFALVVLSIVFIYIETILVSLSKRKLIQMNRTNDRAPSNGAYCQKRYIR